MTGQRRSRMTDSVCDLWSTEPWPLQLTPDHCKRAQRFTATSQGASSGHGVRPEEGWGGVVRRGGRQRAGEGTGRLYLWVSCLFVSLLTVPNLQTMAGILTVLSVYGVRLLSAVVRPVVLSALFFISFRMARWGTLTTWLRSILSITALPSVTCVKGWRSSGNAK